MESSKNRRRRSIQEDVWRWAFRSHAILRGLSPEETAKLTQIAAQFAREKVFEGAEGLTVTDEMRASISIQAALPVLQLGIDWYRDWRTIVVVPKDFINRDSTQDRAGVVHEWEETDSGESWEHGPVVLSWQDVEASGWCDGYNVVIHEAAHRLDMTDGSINGRPFLHGDGDGTKWYEVCSTVFEDLKSRARGRRRSKIDTYATEDDAEFFAVLSEYFFELPDIVRREYPDLYELFAAFYRQDPAKRLAGVPSR